MRLYHLTTAAPCAGTVLASGSFTGSRKQEIVVASGTHLHLYRRLKSGALHAAITAPMFGTVRALGVFRLPGTTRDYLAATSDSGCLTVFRADGARAAFTPVANEPFGRSGARRAVPGEYLACDPQGRALMVAAVERSKFVYVLGRDDAHALSLSSPLEAHRAAHATYALAALDVGFDNPVFAALERAYEPGARLSLVYYELDLGLNHVVRKQAAPVPDDAFTLLAVPGEDDGPGGVIVCSATSVSYRHLTEEDKDGKLLPRADGADVVMPEPGSERPKYIEALLPFREGDADPTQRMVVCGTLFKHKDKGRPVFFFMLSNDLGDLIRVELLWTPDEGAKELRMAYFDSLPSAAIDIRILKSGYLFALVEGGDSLFLKFKRPDVPADDPAGGFSSSRAGKAARSASFRPRSSLTHLSLAESIPSLGPTLAMHSGDFTGEGSSQLVLAGGRGGGGGFVRVLRPGLAVEDRIETLVLKGAVDGIFGFRERRDDATHTFLALSFPGKTTILRVTDDSLREVTAGSGFKSDTTTLCLAQMGGASHVQIHARGVRFVGKERAEWRPPAGVRVVAGAANGAQALAALSDGAVVYFELSDTSGALVEAHRLAGALAVAGDDADATLGAADADARPALALPPVPAARVRAQFFAVADGATQRVRVYRVRADGPPQRAGLHVAPAPVRSVALVDFGAVAAGVRAAGGGGGGGGRAGAPPPALPPRLVLFVGTRHGALVRLAVDGATGALSQRRSVFLGPAPVTAQGLVLAGVPACVVMGARAWVFFPQGARVAAAPLCTSPFARAAPFDTPGVPGFAVAAGSRVRMLALPALSALAASAALPPSVAPAAVPAATMLAARTLAAKFRAHATPRRLVPLFSIPSGAGGFGEAPHLGAVGIDTDALVATRQGNAARVDRTGHDLFLVVESDHRAELQEADEVEPGSGAVPEGDAETAPRAQNGAFGSGHRVMKRMRSVSAPEGTWASQMRLVSIRHADSLSKDDGESTDVGSASPPFFAPGFVQEAESVTSLDVLQLGKRECVLCATASLMLADGDGGGTVTHVVASVCKNLAVNATGRRRRRDGNERGCVENELRVYRVDETEKKLEFVHRTVLADGEENSVHALAGFRDVVLAGSGRSLRAYKLGKKQLLRRGEQRHAAANKIAALCVAGGDRVFVGDVQQSVTVFRFCGEQAGRGGRMFTAIARDTVARWTTALCAVDYSTVCVGDKFGSIAVLRMPDGAHDDADPAARGAAPAALAVEACVHVGAAVTQVIRVGAAALRYATAQGALGALVALPAQADANLTKQLERRLREERSPIGRDHTAMRSAFYPVKNVFDGDLCETLLARDAEWQAKIAKELGRELPDVKRALLGLRWVAECE